MKRLNIYRYVLGALFLGLIVSQAFAGPVDKEKKVSKNFTLKANTLVSLDNKYGQMHIDTYEGNVLEVNITIVVKHKSDQAAQRILDKISIDFDQSSDEVSIQTVIDGNINMNRDESFEINYHIKMPINNSLEVDNSYGALYLADFNGKADIKVSYGQIKIDQLNGPTELELAYGGGELESMKSGSLEVRYSKMTAGKLGKVDVELAYSTLTCESLLNGELDNRYSNLTIDKVGVIAGDIKYGSLKIGELTESLNVEGSYGGGITVDVVKKGFKEVRIETSYTGIKIGLAPACSGTIEGEFDYCDLSSNIDFDQVFKESHENRYSGKFGTGTGGAIIIKSRYGGAKVWLDK